MCKKRMALEGESRQRHHYHYHQLNHHQQQQQHQSDNGSSSQSAMSSPRSSSSSSANTHSRGLPLLLPTDHHQADHVFSSPSSPEEEEAGPLQMGEGGRMALLQDKMKRTTKMLKEIQALTAACEEMPPHGDVKEKQVGSIGTVKHRFIYYTVGKLSWSKINSAIVKVAHYIILPLYLIILPNLNFLSTPPPPHSKNFYGQLFRFFYVRTKVD